MLIKADAIVFRSKNHYFLGKNLPKIQALAKKNLNSKVSYISNVWWYVHAVKQVSIIVMEEIFTNHT